MRTQWHKLLFKLKIDFWLIVSYFWRNNATAYAQLRKSSVTGITLKDVAVLLNLGLKTRALTYLKSQIPKKFKILKLKFKAHLQEGNADFAARLLNDYLLRHRHFPLWPGYSFIAALRQLIAQFPKNLAALDCRNHEYVLKFNRKYQNLFFKKYSWLSLILSSPHDYILHQANQGSCNKFKLEKLNYYFKQYSLMPLSLIDLRLNMSVVNLAGNIRSAQLNNNDCHLVSIVMPVYNVAKYIQAAINSILEQTYTNWELIIVDDGSTDASMEIALGIARSDLRIKCYSMNEKSGTAAARNHGMKQAGGEYLIFQDADDFAHPQRVEILATTLTRHKFLVAITHQYMRLNDDGDFFSHLVWPYTRYSPITVILRRQIALQSIGGMRHVGLGEDSEYLIRLKISCGNKKIAHLNLPLLIQAHRAGSSLNPGSGSLQHNYLHRQYQDLEQWSEQLLSDLILNKSLFFSLE